MEFLATFAIITAALSSPRVAAADLRVATTVGQHQHSPQRRCVPIISGTETVPAALGKGIAGSSTAGSTVMVPALSVTIHHSDMSDPASDALIVNRARNLVGDGHIATMEQAIKSVEETIVKVQQAIGDNTCTEVQREILLQKLWELQAVRKELKRSKCQSKKPSAAQLPSHGSRSQSSGDTPKSPQSDSAGDAESRGLKKCITDCQKNLSYNNKDRRSASDSNQHQQPSRCNSRDDQESDEHSPVNRASKGHNGDSDEENRCDDKPPEGRDKKCKEDHRKHKGSHGRGPKCKDDPKQHKSHGDQGSRDDNAGKGKCVDRGNGGGLFRAKKPKKHSGHDEGRGQGSGHSKCHEHKTSPKGPQRNPIRLKSFDQDFKMQKYEKKSGRGEQHNPDPCPDSHEHGHGHSQSKADCGQDPARPGLKPAHKHAKDCKPKGNCEHDEHQSKSGRDKKRRGSRPGCKHDDEDEHGSETDCEHDGDHPESKPRRKGDDGQKPKSSRDKKNPHGKKSCQQDHR